jgi:hypothetical protein
MRRRPPNPSHFTFVQPDRLCCCGPSEDSLQPNRRKAIRFFLHGLIVGNKLFQEYWVQNAPSLRPISSKFQRQNIPQGLLECMAETTGADCSAIHHSHLLRSDSVPEKGEAGRMSFERSRPSPFISTIGGHGEPASSSQRCKRDQDPSVQVDGAEDISLQQVRR